MLNPHAALVAANLVYATAPAVTRVVLEHVGPAALALLELIVASMLLLPFALRREPLASFSRADRGRVIAMGLVGFSLAFMLSNWGLRLSTASNAALLITIEPTALMVLSPLLLGEHLTRREGVGALLTVWGAIVIIVNGVPGVSAELVPHWRGDLLLVLAPLAYASYTLLGRKVLSRHSSISVTAWSLLWGAVGLSPAAIIEYWKGPVSVWTPTAVAGLLYLAVVVVALAFVAWNYALERVEAPRAAIFLNLQPLAGALLAALWLGEPLTPFTMAGGLVILGGLRLAVRRGQTPSPAATMEPPAGRIG